MNSYYYKKTIFLLIVLSGLSGLFPFSMAQKPANIPSKGHDIRFKINGYKDSSAIIAHYYGDNQYIPKDTAKFDIKGNIRFKGSKDLPEGVYLLVLPKSRYVEFLVGEQFQSLEFDSSDAVSTMKVKEGRENQIFYEYQKLMAAKTKEAGPLRSAMGKTKNPDSTAALKKKLEQIDKEVKAFREKLFTENPQSFAVKLFKTALDPDVPDAPVLPNGRRDSLFQFRFYKAHYFDNLDLSDDRMIRTPVFHNKLEQYVTKMTLQIPDSINLAADLILNRAKSKEIFKYVVWWVTNHYEKSQIMGMDAVFVHMAKNYYLNGKAYWVDSSTVTKIRDRAKILEPILIGKTAPNIFLTDSSGNLKPLYGFKSKTTILYFWDPNCGHCQKETPKLHEFWEKNKQKGIGVYAVSIDRKPDDWKKFVREKGLKWTNVWDSQVVTDFKNIYDIYSTPVMYILDENKKILAKRIGVEQLPDFFDNYFKDKIGGAVRE